MTTISLIFFFSSLVLLFITNNRIGRCQEVLRQIEEKTDFFGQLGFPRSFDWRDDWKKEEIVVEANYWFLSKRRHYYVAIKRFPYIRNNSESLNAARAQADKFLKMIKEL